MNIQHTEQRIDSSPSSARGISRRRFLGMMLAVPAGIIAACSPARPSAPLGAGPGPGESGQDTTGLRSVPPEVKTAAAKPHPAEETAMQAHQAILSGDYKGFDQKVSPENRYSPEKRVHVGISGIDVEAFESCGPTKYTVEDGGYADSNIHQVAIIYDEPCMQYPGYPKTDTLIFEIEPLGDEWFVSKFYPKFPKP